MKDYFKKLKDHPGIGTATAMTIMTFAAVATNKSIHSVSDVLIFGSIWSAIIWIIVLITNLKK